MIVIYFIIVIIYEYFFNTYNNFVLIFDKFEQSFLPKKVLPLNIDQLLFARYY